MLTKQSIAISILAFLAALAADPFPRANQSFYQEARAQVRPEAGPLFQPEVTRLKSEGLQLKEAVESSLDGKAIHLAGIFQRTSPKSPVEAFELRILESDGKTASTIFRRADFFFTFSSGDTSSSPARDINGDGLKELIVQSSSGGNCWSCNATEIYRVRAHKAELIAAGPIRAIVDLDGDGISELLVTDTRWEVYADLSHAASPFATIVYAWRNGKYVNASRDFSSYYRREIDRMRSVIIEAKDLIMLDNPPDDSYDDSYIGTALSIGITFAHMGDIERGEREIETLLRSNIRSPKQSQRRDDFISDFRDGESRKKLQAMKYGDPLL